MTTKKEIIEEIRKVVPVHMQPKWNMNKASKEDLFDFLNKYTSFLT